MSRELPHSNEAEQAILGGMMVYPSVSGVVYDQGLEPSDFYLDIHQRIFSAMMDITNSGKPVDVTTLLARLQDIEQLHLVGGADYIIKLSDTAISAANSMSVSYTHLDVYKRQVIVVSLSHFRSYRKQFPYVLSVLPTH